MTRSSLIGSIFFFALIRDWWTWRRRNKNLRAYYRKQVKIRQGW